MYQAGTGNVANISVHHNSAYPSQLILPGINPILGFHQQDNFEFGIYPNPANDELNIKSNEEIVGYQIIDMRGKVVFTEANFNGNSINISQLDPAVYILKLRTSTGDSSEQKFSKL